MNSNLLQARRFNINPENDPWDPIYSLKEHGRHTLTSIEFTVTNMCNMRCEHCAVGDSLTMAEGARIPLELALKKLDEVEHLQTISITGGEPMLQQSTVREYILPILQYAHSRGIRSQLNSNLTLDYSRYEIIAPYLDVLHISFNYTSAKDYYDIGFARTSNPVNEATAAMLYERMIDNAARLSEGGLFVSAESMINYRTHDKMAEIHRLIVEMGCQRHEVHPMYASDFASALPAISLSEMRTAIHQLLDERNPDIWVLFGTLPFYHCNSDPEDRRLLQRLQQEANVTVRNDPDGRNRLNVELFTGDIHVTDFSDVPPLGNIHHDSFDQVFDRWTAHSLYQTVNCHCPAVSCCGPNLLVKEAYYKEVDFLSRKAIIPEG